MYSSQHLQKVEHTIHTGTNLDRVEVRTKFRIHTHSRRARTETDRDPYKMSWNQDRNQGAYKMSYQDSSKRDTSSFKVHSRRPGTKTFLKTRRNQVRAHTRTTYGVLQHISLFHNTNTQILNKNASTKEPHPNRYPKGFLW